MRKIPTLFERDFQNNGAIIDIVHEGCEWMIAGEGQATVKHDGTCCMVREGKLFKRYELKRGKNPPANFEPASDFDENTGKQQGWVPVGSGPEDSYHAEGFAWLVSVDGVPQDGTYELIGPKIQGNPECVNRHVLVLHGSVELQGVPTSYQGLREWFQRNNGIEGIVWHHPDGRMAKIKLRDFGIERASGIAAE